MFVLIPIQGRLSCPLIKIHIQVIAGYLAISHICLLTPTDDDFVT